MGYCITFNGKLLKLSTNNCLYITPFCNLIAEAAESIYFSIDTTCGESCQIEETTIPQLVLRVVSENKTSKTKISAIGRVTKLGVENCYTIEYLKNQISKNTNVTTVNGILTILP